MWARSERMVSDGSNDVCSLARLEVGDWPLRRREFNRRRMRLKAESDGQPITFGLVSSILGKSFSPGPFILETRGYV